MSDPFSLFLWFLTVISFIYYGVAGDSNGLMLVIILLIVIFSGATIQYIYNKDSAKTIDSIKSIIPLYCNVIRDGI
jgi:magnesium-transporting ATPase (P-type)